LKSEQLPQHAGYQGKQLGLHSAQFSQTPSRDKKGQTGKIKRQTISKRSSDVQECYPQHVGVLEALLVGLK
jgi:hypothetical protein